MILMNCSVSIDQVKEMTSSNKTMNEDDAYSEYVDAIEDTVQTNLLIDTFKSGRIEVKYEITLDDYKPMCRETLPDLAHRIIIRTESDDEEGTNRRIDIYQYNGFTEEVNWRMDCVDACTGFQLYTYNKVLVEGELFYTSNGQASSFHIFPTTPETIFLINAKLF